MKKLPLYILPLLIPLLFILWKDGKEHGQGTLTHPDGKQKYEKYLLEANTSYNSGDKETAKELYLKAADKGSAEAHFAIAYKYIVTPKESIYHFSEAAKKGHEKALGHALDNLLFRADSLRMADPQRALDIYYEAKKVNPAIRLYEEEKKVRVMKMCAEPKGFDVEKFLEKYGVEDEDGQYPFYDVWELAEEASREGRFGMPDPELVLNLVIRGGGVPAEREAAVEETYNNWKNDVVKEFNICDYVTSGAGGGYCANRADQKAKKERDAILYKLIEAIDKHDKDSEQLLNEAYDSAVKFIELKTENEEGHGGSGRTGWIIASRMEQKSQYLELIERIHAGFKPSPENSFQKADHRLNDIYQKVITKLPASILDTYRVSPDDIRKVQRSWIAYRDASVNLFVQINPSIDKNIWKSWLTETRTKELEAVLSFVLEDITS